MRYIHLWELQAAPGDALILAAGPCRTPCPIVLPGRAPWSCPPLSTCAQRAKDALYHQQTGAASLQFRPPFRPSPLDLLTSVDGILYAKTVCESSCPGAAEVCSRADMPCTRGNQYV